MIVTRVYGGSGRGPDPRSGPGSKQRKLTELGCGNLPVCMAKTQYSFSDDPKLLGAPEGFTVTVRQLKLSAGAGFVVALTGRHHDHARPAQGARRRGHRRGRSGQHHRPFLIFLRIPAIARPAPFGGPRLFYVSGVKE